MACRSQQTRAVESMKNPSTRQALVRLFGKEIRNEVRLMSSESFYQASQKMT